MEISAVPTLADLARSFDQGSRSRDIIEQCLARIAAPEGEGRRTFLKVHAEQARAAADFHDTMRRNGAAASPFAGIPVSIKDLFDIAGDTTTAGSMALRDAPPAKRETRTSAGDSPSSSIVSTASPLIAIAGGAGAIAA